MWGRCRSLFVVVAVLLASACGVEGGRSGGDAFLSDGVTPRDDDISRSWDWSAYVPPAPDVDPQAEPDVPEPSRPADVPAPFESPDIVAEDVPLAPLPRLGPPKDCVDQTGLAGPWTGTWSGEIIQWPDDPIAGMLFFEVSCGDLKMPIVGRFAGIADYEYPFRGELLGELDVVTGEVTLRMVHAEVVSPVVPFEGVFRARRDGTRFVEGSWEAAATVLWGYTGLGVWAAERDAEE